MVFDSKSIICSEDLKKLQEISIALRGMNFTLETGKKISENYLFDDCGEKLDPNNVLHETYSNYQSINCEELEKFSQTIDNICFPNGIDYNHKVFDELSKNKSDNLKIKPSNYKERRKLQHPYYRINKSQSLQNLNHNMNYNQDQDDNHEDYCGFDKTLYKLGHLSMNPREEPFLGDEA